MSFFCDLRPVLDSIIGPPLLAMGLVQVRPFRCCCFVGSFGREQRGFKGSKQGESWKKKSDGAP